MGFFRKSSPNSSSGVMRPVPRTQPTAPTQRTILRHRRITSERHSLEAFGDLGLQASVLVASEALPKVAIDDDLRPVPLRSGLRERSGEFLFRNLLEPQSRFECPL
jgi:hypothetical protein